MRILLEKYSTWIKYGGSFLAFFLLIIAVRTYINFTTIQNTISSTEYEILQTEDKIAFTENFLLKYLDSEYASYFLAHENNNLFAWEYIIQLKEQSTQAAVQQTQISTDQNDNRIQTPQESWQYYLKEKFSKI